MLDRRWIMQVLRRRRIPLPEGRSSWGEKIKCEDHAYDLTVHVKVNYVAFFLKAKYTGK